MGVPGRIAVYSTFFVAILVSTRGSSCGGYIVHRRYEALHTSECARSACVSERGTITTYPLLAAFFYRYLPMRMQEILQLSIPEEYRNAVGGSKENALYNFNGVLREDATQEVCSRVHLSTKTIFPRMKKMGGMQGGGIKFCT